MADALAATVPPRIRAALEGGGAGWRGARARAALRRAAAAAFEEADAALLQARRRRRPYPWCRDGRPAGIGSGRSISGRLPAAGTAPFAV